MVPVQVLVGVSTRRSSQTHRRETESGQTTAGTGDDLLLVQRVSTAGAEGRRAGWVGGRGVVPIVVGGGSVRGSAPAERPAHNHIVVVQIGEGRQTGRPVGDGRPPAFRHGRCGGIKGSRGVRGRWRLGVKG